jgi:hypothetical protein
MDPAPLVSASGQSLRELQPAVPIELNRKLNPGLYLAAYAGLRIA